MVEVKLIERGVFGVVGHKLAENDCMLSADPVPTGCRQSSGHNGCLLIPIGSEPQRICKQSRLRPEND